MIALEDRILLHLQDGRRIPVDPQEIYLLKAEGGETLVRARPGERTSRPSRLRWRRLIKRPAKIHERQRSAEQCLARLCGTVMFSDFAGALGEAIPLLC